MANNHIKTNKLKPLLNEVPPGFIVDAAWLVARKIDRKSIHDYAKRGWLERVMHGLYRRPFLSNSAPNAVASWVIPILSMQKLMHYDVHVGGKTALSVYGHKHYLNFSGREVVYLYGDEIPAWLKRYPSPHVYMTRTRSLFRNAPPSLGIDETTNITDTSPGYSQWSLTLASPERAILELINELPNRETFEAVDLIFEGLVNLRPKHLHELLLHCRSIKVKRLFLVFADRHQHAWHKHLDTQAYDLGAGPRALAKGGQIHPVYNIAVPKEYLPATNLSSNDGP